MLAAAYRVRDERPLVLNFASARNPGGGHRTGARGQEEDLCRQSRLADALTSPDAAPFYKHHAEVGPLNSDWCLYAPAVEVLTPAWTCAVLSCAAPHARDAHLCGYSTSDLASVLRTRASRVAHVAYHHGHTTLVLGAWGCGAFGNDPRTVASALLDATAWAKNVVFAVRDHAPGRWVYQTFVGAVHG